MECETTVTFKTKTEDLNQEVTTLFDNTFKYVGTGYFCLWKRPATKFHRWVISNY